MRLKDILSEDIDKETFVKLLKNKAEFDITNTGTKLKATTVAQYGTEEADKILGVQLPKVKTAAAVMGVEWKMLYAKQFVQHPGYMGGNKRPVWTYALTGTDKDGNEVTYWKYEGQVAGGGQSNLFINKDTNSKVKLSWIIDPSNKKEAKSYAKNWVKGKQKLAAQQATLGKKKLSDEDIYKLLTQSKTVKNYLASGAKLLKPMLSWRLVFKTGSNFGDAFIFIPSTNGRVKLKIDFLNGAKEIKTGTSSSSGYTVGIFNTIEDATKAISAHLR